MNSLILRGYGQYDRIITRGYGQGWLGRLRTEIVRLYSRLARIVEFKSKRMAGC